MSNRYSGTQDIKKIAYLYAFIKDSGFNVNSHTLVTTILDADEHEYEFYTDPFNKARIAWSLFKVGCTYSDRLFHMTRSDGIISAELPLMLYIILSPLTNEQVIL